MDANNQPTPTRRLTTKERKLFNGIVADFPHLTPADSEQLTQYAEAVTRYQYASKESKKNPTVTLPVTNRSTGNVTGSKIVRNPAFVTLREASAQMVSLGRRLLIDAHSAEKRLRMQSKKSRSFARVESDAIAARNIRDGLTEEQITEGFDRYGKHYGFQSWCDEEMRRQLVIEWLCEPLFHLPPCTKEQIEAGDVYACEEPDDGL